MIKLTHIVTVTTALVIGLSGVASAKEGDRTERGNKQRTDMERSARNRSRDVKLERSVTSRPARDRDLNRRGSGSENRVDRRQENQRARIRDGRESGALTRWESKKLRRDQKKISRTERRFERDGHLNKREQHILNKKQDRASRRIYQAKNNDRSRGDHRGKNWGSHRNYGHSRKWVRGDHHGKGRGSRRDYGHSRKMGRGWGHGRHSSTIVINPVVEQVAAYEPALSSSLAFDLQFDGVNIGWSKTSQN